MGTIFVDKLDPQSGTNLTLGSSGDTVTLTSGAKTSGFGKIGQIQSTTLTSTVSISSSSTSTFADVTGLSVNITPTSTSSKILVLYTLSFSAGAGSKHMRLMRDSTAINIGDAGQANQIRSTVSSRPAGTVYDLDTANQAGQFLDSPSSTSQITYKIQVTLGASYSSTAYINRTTSDNNNDFEPRTTSGITVMEILD
tara:strand:- start:497 stop:1087 length:591 start_codon:yes stop_codon:yes gene_type:complete